MFTAKRVLLLYISVLSGHHRAAMAVEKALKFINSDTQVYSINSFHYTNPILERVINRTYLQVIKFTPEVWEYLYDNPKVIKNTQRLKEMIHRFNSVKIKQLIEDFKPDVIACTQAFPCGLISDYKISFGSNVPLVGILTDFYPHSYWIYDAVDKYVVPSEEAKKRLIEHGVPSSKICHYGIPIDTSFADLLDPAPIFQKYGLSNKAKTILVMGGSAGLGPIKKLVFALDRISANMQMIIVTGTNLKLYKYLKRHSRAFKKKVVILGYADNVNELMTISDIIVTKPGGLTASEALAKGLAMVIINPIPGQEAKNTEFLLSKNTAIKANNEKELAILAENLCLSPYKLDAMKEAAASLGKPTASIDIARMILEM